MQLPQMWYNILLITGKSGSNMRIYIDNREDDERILFLKNDPFFHQITVKRLDVGDILIERDDHEDIVI